MSDLKQNLAEIINQNESCVCLLPDSMHWGIIRSLMNVSLALQFVADHDENSESMGVIQLATDELLRVQETLDRVTLKSQGLVVQFEGRERFEDD